MRAGLRPDEVYDLLYKKSGMLGVSGVSSDFRDLAAATKQGNERAALARKMFCYKVRQFIGAYAATLGGVDAIVMTAGVAENDGYIREMILQGLEYLGVDMDWEFNLSCPRATDLEITKPTSKVHVYVIPTDEEMTIARDTAALALQA